MAATSPEELLADWGRKINAGDLEAVLTLYEPDAVAVVPKVDGGPVRGKDGVRQVLEPFLALKPTFTLGRFRDVLHRQPDGTWLIAIDNPFGDD